jgi:uncharacterized protein (TIGR03663 family)
MRLVLLGDRLAHWDEARVAFWVYRYAETGVWEYRPIVHGPFLFHVDRLLFEWFGASDATMRLPVAVIGGLAPLAALLFRERLRDDETVALATLLAGTPLLLYYSRFLRNDVPVAVFALVTFGLLVRAADTGRGRYVAGAGLAFALAMTAKENALLYPLNWLGAVVAVGGWRVWRRAGRQRAVASVSRWGSLRSQLAENGRRVTAAGRDMRGWLVVTPLAAITVLLAFYAPRPIAFDIATLEAATVGSAKRLFSLWVAGDLQSHSYATYTLYFAGITVVGGAGVAVFAAVGWVSDRRRREPRTLVALTGVWWLTSLAGYPIVADIKAPWLTVHILVPLLVPAAVGLAAWYRRASGAVPTGALVGRRVAAVTFVLAVTGTLVVGSVGSYTHPTAPGNLMAQWAQPGDELRPGVDRAMQVAAAHDDGTDVLYYGTRHPNTGGTLLYVRPQASQIHPPPGHATWYSRLPLPWYFERVNATTTSTRPGNGTLADPPPVVITHAWNRSEVAGTLSGYRPYTGRFKLLGETIRLAAFNRSVTYEGERVTIFIDPAA